MGEVTRVGLCGRIWPSRQFTSSRKRFCAWFERGKNIRVKYFSTRRAARDWLTLMEAKP